MLMHACTKDRSELEFDILKQPLYQKIDIITGLQLYDANGIPIGNWRSPNDLLTEASIFPNPTNGFVHVSSLQNIEQLWLIESSCLHDTIHEHIFQEAQETVFTINDFQELSIMDVQVDQPTTQLSLDISHLSTGLYRVFIQLKTGQITWQNIFYQPNININFPFETLDTYCP